MADSVGVRGKPHILHVSGDFPDAIAHAKTPVIRTLLDLTRDDFDHRVISLNRQSPPVTKWLFPRLEVHAEAAEDGVLPVSYMAPPHGLHHHRLLEQLGDWIAQHCVQDGKPDLLVGHKLGIEGIAVARAASRLGIPYALSIQGNTDQRILAARPDLRRRLARIYHGAAHVFPFTPWARKAVESRVGARNGGVTLLPCAMARDDMLAPVAGDGGIVTAFHLRNAGIKNLGALAAAARQASVPLTVIGGGSEAELEAARSLAGPHIEFAGAVDNSQIAARFNAASGFAMPSRRESFGLVFVEALFAGCPIAYPAGAAVDGYFDDCPFALRVDASDSGAIADALRTLVASEVPLKQSLAEWQQGEAARRFTRPAIAAAFASGLREAMR